ncbi:CMRF35-like molecule 8 [Sardina pilchardus]|uniref:CMRF35-like molecule 8 n=1 Tax=Sardina pilchardus TaxID=27697 RepID=UPI002E103A17
MKTSINIIILSLTVLRCVSCEDITVNGNEGGNAVINCLSQKGYESYSKYLLKGEYKDRVDVIRSDGQAVLTHRGRVSLQDKKDTNKFIVTIRNLTIEDAGTYGCGVDKWFEDLYTTVKLTVDRKPNKPTPAIPKVTVEVSTATLSNTVSVSTHNATTRPLYNITESVGTKHFQSDPTSAASGGHLAILSGGLVVAVVIFGLLVVTFRLMKRSEKKRASPLSGNTRPDVCVYSEIQPTSPHALPTPLSGYTRPDSCVYSEIQPTSPHATDGPNQSDLSSSPALTSIYALATHPAPPPAQHHIIAKAANQHPQPTATGDDIYSLATHPTRALHSGATSAANQHELCPATDVIGSDVIYSLATNLMPSLPTCASTSSTNNQQPESGPAIYCNLTSANENPDGCEYATVVFSNEPIVSPCKTQIEFL